MVRQLQTGVSDPEMEHIEAAAKKAGMTVYTFLKQAALDRATSVLEKDMEPLVEEMVQALAGRKWHLTQMVDYSDHNQLKWLEMRYPQAVPRQLEQAVRSFRNWQVQAKVE